MNIALIGTSKIASVHLRILLNLKATKKIYVISRSLKKAKNFINKYKFKNKNKIFPSNIKILDVKKFKIIDVCSNTDVHHKILKKIKLRKPIILIEKPLVNPDKINGKISDYLNKIYKKHEKLIVCYPFLFLSKSVLKILKTKNNIKSISFYFFTSGNKNYKDIFYDLFPHAYPFICKMLNLKKLDIKANSINKKISKNYYNLKFLTSDNRKISIFFKQDKKFRKPYLKFKINNKIITRTTKIKGNEFLNIINLDNKKHIVSNPMDQFISNMYKNRINKSYFTSNKKITNDLFELQTLLVS